MIVKAIPAVSGMAVKNNPSPLNDAVDFSATLGQKLAVHESKPSLNDKTSHSEPLFSTQENLAEKSGQEELLELPLDVLLVEQVAQEQLIDPVFSIDPQLQHLQQLVANAALGGAVMATPMPVEVLNEQPTGGVTPALADAELPSNESQSRTTPWLGQSLTKNLAPVSVNIGLDGKQGADKIAAEQHDAFLATTHQGEMGQKNNGLELIRPEATTPLPLTPDNRSVLMPDVSLRPQITAVNDVSPPQAPAAASSALNQPLGTPAWQQALGQQLSYFSRNGIHNAELRLHPEELGALQISLRLNSDQAQLHFVTENHQVRAALEAAMPHLRTSMAESGIHLGQSSVGADGSSSWNASSQSEDSAKQRHFTGESDDLALATDDQSEINTKTIHYSNGINTFV
ncbi:flagellar hook-length control protein FliK [Yersinia enterocolitica]